MALTQQQQAELAALVAAYAEAQAQIEERLLEQLRSLVSRMFPFGWFDRSAETRFIRESAQVVRDAQEQVADMTGQYLDSVFDVMGIRIPTRDRYRPVKLPPRLRAVDANIEWARPARDNRVMRLKGLDELEAQERALWRAEEQARMDLQLAAQEAERQKYGLAPDDELIGHRRIVRPERSKTGPCGLCIVAATRIYKKGELKPLHGGCVCGSLPVTKAADPGLDMNREDFEFWVQRGKDAEGELQKISVSRERLESWYAAAGGTDRESLMPLQIPVLQHGELGPVLVSERHKNRTPEETRKLAEKGMDPDKIWEIQDRLVRKFERMVAAGNTDVAGALEYHRRQRDRWAAKRTA